MPRDASRHKRAVLGIDAAWTIAQPSGVALVLAGHNDWCLRAVAPSYRHFCALADETIGLDDRPTGSRPDAAAIISAAEALGGRTIDIIAVDMPLAHSPITSRRVSDNAVSVIYGSRHCSTHSPNVARPGQISDNLQSQFMQAGYSLQTMRIEPKSLIEVYPHPALVELAKAERRLPYKLHNIARYWKGETRVTRLARLLSEWQKIVELLDGHISNVAALLPVPAATAGRHTLKAFEDCLDAVVCAWVGTCALEGRAIPFGNKDSAIWIPVPTGVSVPTT